MRSVKFTLGTILTILFVAVFLQISSYANGPSILMYLWQGETNAEKGFRDALAEEFPDQNINYTVLDIYKDTNRLKELIDMTDQTQYQLIYTYGSTITSRVAKAYKSTPIVFSVVFDPIGYKIIESWEEKQPNLTGVSNSIPINLLIQKMHQVFGKGDIGFIYNPLDKNSVKLKEEMEAYLAQSEAGLLSFEFRENFESMNTYLDSIKNRAKCVYLPTEYLIVGYIERIFSNLNRVNLPSCVTSKAYLKRGGLLCITTEYYDVGKMSGKLAAKILKGAKPNELPVQRPSGSDITLYANLMLLKRLNMELPQDLEINYTK